MANLLSVKEKLFLPSDDDSELLHAAGVAVHLFQLGSLLTECAWDLPLWFTDTISNEVSFINFHKQDE